MQYGIGQAEAVHSITGDDHKAEALVKAQSLRVLFVHIYAACPEAKGFTHEGRTDAAFS